MQELKNIQGTDIYLLDQIMKGRYAPGDKILDAGCGSGRNMVWFTRNGYDVWGCDFANEAFIHAMERTGLTEEKFYCCPLENMPYDNDGFDHVICNAVLHFAQSEEHFLEMIKELHRVLKPGGSLFIRMTSVLGLPENYQKVEKGRYLLQDGTERFLLTKPLLEGIKNQGFGLLEPVKSVLVEELRSMTTLVLEKK